ncbi:putative pectin lyase precursor [Rhizoctonia solani]|nr:putative pectin lyase precursor [Rhizoctonia solani]
MFTLLAISLLSVRGALAVGSPFGYASGTTEVRVPPKPPLRQRQSCKAGQLEDTVTRNILLDKTYDFTDLEGSVTGTGCKPWTCSPNPQLAINANNWCSSSYETTTITYKKAGTSGIRVGSNKTILGKGTSGKGKGLLISGKTNVIIQNVRFSDINAQYVWGGDAIYVDNSSKIWIDHNYFKNVGRQFIVTGFGAVTGLTISNNYFDGKTTYSTGCDQHHYWVFLFAGNGDQITLARNYVYYTAGRGPHIGGTSGYTQTLHMYNNYFNDITGHALDPETGSRVLMEGNYFNAVKTPSTGDTAGTVFAPTSSTMNAQCSSTLGRNCVSNTLTGGSGTLPNAASTAAIIVFTASVVKSASVMDPASVPAYVLANAGLGIVN